MAKAQSPPATPSPSQAASPRPSTSSLLPRQVWPFARSTQAQQLPHSVFIPESDRGWKARKHGQHLDSGRRTSLPLQLLDRLEVPLPLPFVRGRRPRSEEIRHQTSERKHKGKDASPKAIRTRKRTQSVPASTHSSASQPSPLSPSVLRRRSLHFPFSRPRLGLRRNSIDQASGTSSPAEDQTLERLQEDGYEWREGAPRTVPPSYRNPTAKQAFIDTHFGASSGLNGLQSLPLATVRGAKFWGKAKSAKKSRAKEEGDSADTTTGWAGARWKEVVQGWHSLPSLGIFASDHQSDEPAPDPSALPIPEARTAHAADADGYTNLDGNVVILGGYRGSVLRDAKTREMMCIPIKVGVGLRKPTLEVGLTQEDEDRSEELVVPDEMLTHIGRLVDMGARLRARCERRAQVYAWGYDWRLSLELASERLEKFLHELWISSAEEEQGRRGAQVIAHSMGGLVALHALARARNPRIFEGLVFAGTPFQGTANILGPLRFGDAALFNRTVCSPRATFSFRSTFYLLPTTGRCFEDDLGRRHDVDFFDPATFEDLGLSPCTEASRRTQVGARRRKQDQGDNPHAQGHLTTDSSPRGESEGGDLAIDAFGLADVQLAPGNLRNPTKAKNAGPLDNVLDPTRPGEQEKLQLANRQPGADLTSGRSTNRASHAADLSADNPEDIISTDEFSATAWTYLEDTLARTRSFHESIVNSFQDKHLAAGAYPPVAILTSGRTPTVRGALVSGSRRDSALDTDTSDHQDETEAWKDDVRTGDYSRLLYAPGDGVILRSSSVSLPGRWGELLVKPDEIGHLAPSKEPNTLGGIVETTHRHVSLLSDVVGIGRCLDALQAAKLARSVQNR